MVEDKLLLTNTAENWKKYKMMNSEASLYDLSQEKAVLVVFLRHFGCSFCREAIDDIAKKKADFENRGLDIVMVHMSPTQKTAEQFFKKYKLMPVNHISDPECELYRTFGLGKGNPQQLFGLMNWIRGFQASVVEGHGFAIHGVEIGDGFQMPGVFIIHKGKIKNSYIHNHAWDRPDYEAICKF
jgi:peroxiredoxin